ncbi:MAG: flagellar biosynthesis protein FlhF [Gammaproteobacteria bacterium]
MKVKRYFASNMRSALDMVRQEQGPDVLILSNRKVEGGVELITADELTEQEAARLTERPRATDRKSAAPEAASPAAAAAARPAAKPVPSPRPQDLLDSQDLLWTDTATMQQMQAELKGLKGLLETQLSGLAWTDFGARHPMRARLVRMLSRLGISPTLARELADRVPDDLDHDAGWHRALAEMVTRINVQHEPLLGRGARVALLGPTGVGKTTLASKLAARQALATGPESVVIVSLDDRRLGAHQQMKAFGRLIGSPVYTPRDLGELATLLDALGERQLVVIDTPGSAPDDPRFHELVRGLDGLNADVEMYNVISATTDYLAAFRTLERTAELALDACFITKLDEAATLGQVLAAVIETGLPVAGSCAGQRVPDDLDEPDARALVELAVKLANGAPQSSDPAILERAFHA